MMKRIKKINKLWEPNKENWLNSYSYKFMIMIMLSVKYKNFTVEQT